MGLLLGIAAAAGGITPLVGPVRPWHLMVLLAVGLALGSKGRDPIQLSGIDLAVFSYVLVRLIVELINSGQLSYSVNWDSLIYPLWWWLAFLAARLSVSDSASVAALLRGLTIPLLVSVPLALGQALGLERALSLTSQFVSSEGLQARVLNVSQLRAVGFVGHWTHWGAYCAAMVAIGFILLMLSQRHQLGGRPYAYTVVVGGLVGVASSFTFAPVFVVAVVAAVALSRIGANLPTLAALGATSMGVILFLGAGLEERLSFQATGQAKLSWIPDWAPTTISYRLYIWSTETVPMVQDRLLTGWGLNVYSGAVAPDPGRTYPSQLRWPSAESQWLGELMASGLLGLGSLIVLLCAMVILLRRASPDTILRDMRVVTASFLLALAIAATTAPMLTNKGAPLVLWPLVGSIMALQSSKASHAERSGDGGDVLHG